MTRLAVVSLPLLRALVSHAPVTFVAGLMFLAGDAIAAELPKLSAPSHAVACQKALFGASRAFLTTKLRALDGCATAALNCIQLKSSAQKCLTKAKTKCDPDALVRIAKAEDKFVAKVLASCGESKTPLTDLRAPGALGYDTLQAECSDILSGVCADRLDPECTTADDPVGIAACIAVARGRAAEELFGLAHARAREVIGVAQVDQSAFPDLPDHGGEGAATVGPGKEAKRVTTCVGTIAKGALKLTTTVDKTLGNCLAGILACTKNTPAEQPACLGKATDTCKATATKIAAQRGALETAIAKKCGESTLPFATLRSASAANLDALACECESVGIDAVDGLASFDQCLIRHHECRLARLAPLVAPRTSDLLSLVGLGIPDLVCPPFAASALVGLSARPLFFGGGITRFVRALVHVFDRVNGTLFKVGRPPTSLGSAPHTIRRILHPLGRQAAVRGGLSLYRVRFGDLTKNPNASLRAEPRASGTPQPPSLIAAVRRGDGTFEDGYFQVPLSAGEGEDDIEVDFPIDLPSCAFEVAFATVASDGEIGQYVGVEVVPDLTAPIATTPTPTATVSAPLTPTPTFTTPSNATPTPTFTTPSNATPTPTFTTPANTTPTPTFTTPATLTPTPSPQPCASPIVIPATGGVFSGTTSGGANELDGQCPGGSTASPERVFAWTPATSGTASIDTCAVGTTLPTVLYMRDGTCDPQSEVACSIDQLCGSNPNGQRLAPTVVAGHTYYIVVDGFFSQGAFTLTVKPPGAQGSCGNPRTFPAAGGTLSGFTGGADVLDGSCDPTTPNGAPETIFRWTPDTSGPAQMDTCGAGTNFDTVLYLKDSAGCFGQELTCNDQSCGNASRIIRTLNAGQDYYIVVDGYDGQQGNFDLTVIPPGTCTTPIVVPPDLPVPAQDYVFSGVTSGTSQLTGSCAGAGPERVFVYTPSFNQLIRIQTCGVGTNFDTVVHVREGTGNCQNSLAETECANDGGGGSVACSNGASATSSEDLPISVIAGTTYYIIVDGFGSAQGNFQLRIISNLI